MTTLRDAGATAGLVVIVVFVHQHRASGEDPYAAHRGLHK